VYAFISTTMTVRICITLKRYYYDNSIMLIYTNQYYYIICARACVYVLGDNYSLDNIHAVDWEKNVSIYKEK